jgi:hypothetical protein
MNYDLTAIAAAIMLIIEKYVGKFKKRAFELLGILQP